MRLLRMSYLLIIVTILSCKQNGSATEATNDSLKIENLPSDKKEDKKTEQPVDQDEQKISEVEKVKEETQEISDVVKQISDNKDSVIVLVKIAGQNDLVRVLNKNWPEGIETTYNIFKNQQGQIIYIAEFPTSESGDWALKLEYFFSVTGQLTAFVKDFAFFNSPCLSEGIAIEQSFELFDNDFKVIKTIKTLTDKKGKPLDEKKCGNTNYDVEYDIRPTAKDFVELKGIKV